MRLFIPTSEFRWVDDPDANNNVPSGIMNGYNGPEYYKLQQAYQNIKDCTIEWRDIEVEHNPEKEG